MPDQHVSDEHAATLGFSLHGEVTLGLLNDALERFAKVLDALSESYDADIEWSISKLREGSVTAAVLPVVVDGSEHRPGAIQEDYMDAALSVQRGAIDPASRLHASMEALLGLVDDCHSMTVASNGRSVQIDTPIEARLMREPQTYTTLGTVRGHVDTLSRHNELSFRLYELYTGKPVKCYMKQGSEAVMRDIWGHIADVTGTITRQTHTDRPVSITSIRSVERVDPGDPNGWRRARGVLRSDVPAEVLIRRFRDGE